MNVGGLLVTPRWNPEGGGRERYAAELVDAAARRGVTLDVATASAVSGATRMVASWRTQHPHLPVLALDPMQGATHYQSHSGVLAEAYEAECRTFRAPLRRVLAPLGLALNVGRQRRLRAEHAVCTDPATRIMTFSRRDAELFQRRYGTRDTRLTVAHPGINLRRFAPAERPHGTGPVQALFAGHNFQVKGLEVALRALARARTNVTLTVVGGDRPDAWVRLARQLNITDRVHFRGVVDAATLVQLYRTSTVLLHPAAYDPFPRVIVEALACGCPVVTTTACGGAEILRQGDNGWVVDGADVVGRVAEILSTLQSPSVRAAVSNRAVATGRQFDFEAHVSDVLEWLQTG